MRGSRALTFAAAALAFAGGIAWLVWPMRTPGSAPEPALRSAHTSDQEPELGTPRVEEQRSAPENGAPPANEPPGIRIFVVDESGAPVAGVPVGLAWGHEQLPFTKVIAAKATGGDGMAEFELPREVRGPRRLLAAVFLPAPPVLERELVAPKNGDEVRFTLPESMRAWVAPLTVQVLDAASQAVSGASVALRSLLPEHAGTSGNSFGRFTTAADGIARIDRAPLLDDLRQARAVGTRIQLEIAVEAPLADPPRRVLEERELGPADPAVVLVLPATGRVEARVRDADGREPAMPVRVRLAWRTSADEGFQGMWGGRFEELEAGQVTFDGVGLGLELELEAWPVDESVASGRAQLFGPTRAGESVQAALQLGAPRPVLVGRIVDAGGAPRSELGFHLSFHARPRDLGRPISGPTHVEYSYHATDADGRFRIPLLGGSFGPRYVDIEESAPRSGAPYGWIAGFARADLPDPLGGEIVDLGELTLAPTPVLASGTVVDEHGAPVAGAWLTFEYPLGEEGERQWYNVIGPRVTSDAAGAFELRTLLPAPVLRVGASRQGVGVAEPVLVPPGAARLRLVLAPQVETPVGSLRGRVLLDDGLDPTLLAAHCRYASGEKHDSYVIGGHFTFTRLRAGEVDVEIRTYDTDWLVARVAGIHVVAGVENSDARLDALDLRGELRYLRLKLVAPDGKPLAEELVWVSTQGEGGSALQTDATGRLVALTRARDALFELSTNEFAPRTVRYAPDEQELVLDLKE